jgi:hypothetical protein
MLLERGHRSVVETCRGPLFAGNRAANKALLHRAALLRQRGEKRSVPPGLWGYDWGYFFGSALVNRGNFKHFGARFDFDLGQTCLFRRHLGAGRQPSAPSRGTDRRELMAAAGSIRCSPAWVSVVLERPDRSTHARRTIFRAPTATTSLLCACRRGPAQSLRCGRRRGSDVKLTGRYRSTVAVTCRSHVHRRQEEKR